MADLIDIDGLDYRTEKVGDIEVGVATIGSGDFEARISKYPAGALVPMHSHTTEIITVVLRGRCEGPDGKDMVPGILYKCGSFEYGPWRIYEPTIFLTFQPKGSKIKVKK